MNNTFGTRITLTLFGESHGAEIGCVIDGLPAGIPVEEDSIAHRLALRRPGGGGTTARVEPDPFRIVSGVWQGRTTGTPLCILIPNTDVRSGDYVNLLNTPRPGHADYTGWVRYRGFADPRGGGHFSGRLTAPIVAAGAIFLRALADRGIRIGTHLASCGGVTDRPFGDLAADLGALEALPFPVLDPARAAEMDAAIQTAAAEGDSLGGVLETAVLGLPAGLGSPWFDTLEGLLAHALFSIPALKGVEFGDGFAFAQRRGSQVSDSFRKEAGRIVTAENHNGGVNGGITNGMPVVFRTVIKPTPSIGKPQETVNLKTGEPTTIQIKGRHDACIAPRARAVQDAITALVILDLLSE